MKQNRTISYLKSINLAMFIFLTIFICLILSFLVTRFFPVDALKNSVSEGVNNDGFLIVLVVIIGPLFETLLFQEICISAIRALMHRPKHNLYLSVIISASLFSITHTYSVYYILYSFVSGLIFALAYYVAIYRRQSAFFTIFLIHSIWNLIVFVVENMD